MRIRAITFIAFFLFGAALSSPFEINYDGEIQQDVESEVYDGMIQQEDEPGDYDGIIQRDELIQQDGETGGEDGMIQQNAEDYDGLIQQDSEFEDDDGMIQQDAEDYDGQIQQDSEAEDDDGMIQQDMEDYDGLIQQLDELIEQDSEDYDGLIQQDSEPEDDDGMIQQDTVSAQIVRRYYTGVIAALRRHIMSLRRTMILQRSQFTRLLATLRNSNRMLQQKNILQRRRYLQLLATLRNSNRILQQKIILQRRQFTQSLVVLRNRIRMLQQRIILQRRRYLQLVATLRNSNRILQQKIALLHRSLLLARYRSQLTPLYRYWKAAGKASDHFYTTNPFEIGTVAPGLVGKHGYKSEGINGRVYKSRVPGSIPLYRYYRGGAASDHFYTTNAREIGTITPGRVGKYGYKSEGVTGYCFPTRRPGTIPLYRYWNPATVDHFYTTDIREIGTAVRGRRGRYGYTSEGVACYVGQWP